MTDQDLTAPEAVERLISGPLTEIARSRGMPVTDDDVDACKLVAATLRALSAALEAERANCVTMLNEADYDYNRKTNALIKRHAEQIITLKSRAEALDAKLKEAVEALKPFVSAWNIALASGNTAVSRLALIARDETAGVHFMRARAFLASIRDNP